MSRKSDFITLSRQAVRDLMAAFDKISALNREFQANGGGSWLTQPDFTGDNAEINEANFDTAFGNAATLNTYVATQNYDDTFYKIV